MPPNKSIFDNAWLGLGDLDKLVIRDNLMINRSEKDIENPDLDRKSVV